LLDGTGISLLGTNTGAEVKITDITIDGRQMSNHGTFD
jgi:hypothetical protein